MDTEITLWAHMLIANWRVPVMLTLLLAAFLRLSRDPR